MFPPFHPHSNTADYPYPVERTQEDPFVAYKEYLEIHSVLRTLANTPEPKDISTPTVLIAQWAAVTSLLNPSFATQFSIESNLQVKYSSNNPTAVPFQQSNVSISDLTPAAQQRLIAAHFPLYASFFDFYCGANLTRPPKGVSAVLMNSYNFLPQGMPFHFRVATPQEAIGINLRHIPSRITNGVLTVLEYPALVFHSPLAPFLCPQPNQGVNWDNSPKAPSAWKVCQGLLNWPESIRSKRSRSLPPLDKLQALSTSLSPENIFYYEANKALAALIPSKPHQINPLQLRAHAQTALTSFLTGLATLFPTTHTELRIGLPELFPELPSQGKVYPLLFVSGALPHILFLHKTGEPDQAEAYRIFSLNTFLAGVSTERPVDGAPKHSFGACLQLLRTFAPPTSSDLSSVLKDVTPYIPEHTLHFHASLKSCF